MIHRRNGLLGLTMAGVILTILQLWLLKEPEGVTFKDLKLPIILWWKEFGSTGRRTCRQFQCYFTADRELQSHLSFKAIIFYGSHFDLDDLPIPRPSHIQWGLLHEESPRNNPMFLYKEFLNLFNHSSTFSRYSDVPVLQIPGVDELTSSKFSVPFKTKELLMSEEDIAPLLYLQTNCDSTNDRDAYVSELMKYIRVDSYGKCLHNRKMPEHLMNDHLSVLFEEELYQFVAKYKFTLAFENADCEDYITEKLWRPLIVGSVPVYYGSPSFEDWLPNKKAAISVRDFENPKELAEFIHLVSNNQTLYEEYLNHKLVDRTSSIINKRLVSLYAKKPKGIHFSDSLLEFECHICEVVSSTSQSKNFMVQQSHLNCPAPKSALTGQTNPKNPWVDFWSIAKCQAKLFAQHVINNTSINKTLFNQESSRMFLNKEC